MAIQFMKNEELGRPDLEKYRSQVKIPVIVVLDNVRSGLNTGSVFRSSDSFLIEQIYLCGITAQPPEREVLKSALGATESVSWKYFKQTIDAINELKSNGYKVYAIEQSSSAVSLEKFEVSISSRYALVF